MNKILPISIAVLLSANLVACNYPTNARADQGTLEASPTSLANAVQASASPAPYQINPTQPTQTVPRTPEATLALVETSKPNPTLAQASPTAICDRAAAGNPIDITIPDGTEIQPGQTFTKTWRLTNSGSCAWTLDYALVWFSGQSFEAATTNHLSKLVSPGKAIDVSVDMTAPGTPGNYQSNWKLENPAGVLFGIGPSGDSPFWVRIVVNQASEAAPTRIPTVLPTPALYASGVANLHLNDQLDLDTGQLNQGNLDDILYKTEGENVHQLIPQNGARVGIFATNQPTLQDCQAAGPGNEGIDLDSLTPGTYLCVKTNLGLPGWIRFIFLNQQDHTLSLDILTWAVP